MCTADLARFAYTPWQGTGEWLQTNTLSSNTLRLPLRTALEGLKPLCDVRRLQWWGLPLLSGSFYGCSVLALFSDRT